MLEESYWCNFRELAQISRSGTYIEAMCASREKLSLSQKGEWFYPNDLYMICLLILCISFMKVMFILSYCMKSRDYMARYYWHIDIYAWDWDVTPIV